MTTTDKVIDLLGLALFWAVGLGTGALLIWCLINLYALVGLHVLWFVPFAWGQWVFWNSFR